MNNNWGIVGCGYMSMEYCKVLSSRGITPHVYSRNTTSSNVKTFEKIYPGIVVKQLEENTNAISNWIVCTNIESHVRVCSNLKGRIYCEKPYAHNTNYEVSKDVIILMNRRYYYWVEFIKNIIDKGRIVKIVASIPEKSVDALITQSIHVIDLLWYLAGPFQAATKIGNMSPTYVLSTDNDIPLVINMNYGSHENFSLTLYGHDGVVYEARPLEFFSFTKGMEVHEPDEDTPIRTYRPIRSPLPYTSTQHKPGLEELVDDIIGNSSTRLPTLREHHHIHSWMERYML